MANKHMGALTHGLKVISEFSSLRRRFQSLSLLSNFNIVIWIPLLVRRPQFLHVEPNSHRDAHPHGDR